MVEVLEVTQVNNALAEMVALFRVDLRSYKGIVSKPNIDAGREEMEEYLSAKFPVFAALIDGEYAGYVVCRIDSEVVWVESIGSMSILWTKKVERLCCFFKFLILLLLWCQITNRAMYPLTIIPAFYVFKDCSAGFL